MFFPWLEDNYTTYSELLPKNDDVDLAEISMRMADVQATYMASMSAGAKVIQNTLLVFESGLQDKSNHKIPNRKANRKK